MTEPLGIGAASRHGLERGPERARNADGRAADRAARAFDGDGIRRHRRRAEPRRRRRVAQRLRHARAQDREPLPTGARVELRFQPGNPLGVTIIAVDESPAAEPPSWQLDLGTTTAATVVDAGPRRARRRRREPACCCVSPPPLSPAIRRCSPGRSSPIAGGETLVETAIGTLALDLPLALPPGTAIAFDAARRASGRGDGAAAAIRGQPVVRRSTRFWPCSTKPRPISRCNFAP